jgi:hypothetical protein
MISLQPLSNHRLMKLAGLVISVGLVGGSLIASNARKQVDVAPSAAQPRGQMGPPHRVTGSHAISSTNSPAGNVRLQDAIGRSNPLWGIPLASLTATQEKPIFSPTRRAPKRSEPTPIPESSIAASSRPPLVLVGAIAGQQEGIAIFLDPNTKNIVRLKTGETHAGWTLHMVRKREAVLQKDHQSVIVALPSPSSSSQP